ncbi:hypothetical protein ABWK50_26560, partial [Priestia megaterium]|uniref:hypothetical protein n=1 Tax=Priestia megaterium TaxID=1404 RepID=UPI003398AB44
FRARLRFPLAAAVPPGVFVVPSNHQLEAAKYMKHILTLLIKRSERLSSSITNPDSSFGSSFN